VCVGVGVSISVEGCVDVCTSPSMMSSDHSSYEWKIQHQLANEIEPLLHLEILDGDDDGC
jgi:hypothetical protein